MFKFPKIGKNQGIVLITLLVLAMMGAGYFFVYIPNNENTVQERRFRCLQNIDLNIHSKIENSVSMLNYLMKTYPKARPLQNTLGINKYNDSIEKLKNYIADYPKTNFNLLFFEPVSENSFLPGNDSSISIQANYNSDQFTLYLSRLIKGKSANSKPDTLKMGIRYGFEQFVKPLLNADVFDHYIVYINSDKEKSDKKDDKTSSRGDSKLVYETFSSGLSYKTKDSLLSLKNGISGPGVHSLNVGGTDYKVFSQPVNVGTDSKWIIVGLVLNKNYQKEKNQLPLWIVLLLLTVAIGMIVSFPWIKLYHMGNKDKLVVSDGIASILVAILLMSLLFFSFSKYAGFNNRSATSSGKTLAGRMIKAFESQLSIANKMLDVCDSLYSGSPTDIKKLGKKDAENSDTRNANLLQKTNNLLKGNEQNIVVDEVFWIDTTGKEINNWSSHNLFTPHSDLHSREYFKNTIKHNPNKKIKPEFYVDQVVSRTSGFFTSVIAKNSVQENHAVIAMTFTAKSLDSVIMPDGYQFAVIDNKGEVLYHSRPERNLNENLVKELADSTSLVGCLQAMSDTSFDEEYYGRRYHITTKPFKDVPYLAVIFEDQAYNDARDTEAYAFTLSLLLCVMTFQIIQFGIVFIVSSKRSFFKKQLFDTGWIGPKRSLHRQYNLAIMGNLVIIGLLLMFYYYSSFLEYLFILLFSITFISLYVNCIFAITYRKSNPNNSRFKKIAVQWLCFFIAVLDYTAWNNLDHSHFLSLLLFEVLSVVICNNSPLLLELSRKILLPLVSKYKRHSSISWSYTKSFTFMATTQLIITSGIPVAFFFIYAFNYEQNIDTRYRQLIFARALTQKISPVNITDEKVKQINNHKLNTPGVYCDGVFINSIDTSTVAYKPPGDSIEARSTEKVLGAFRLLMNDVERRSNNLNFPLVNAEAHFNNMADETIIKKDVATTTNYKISTDTANHRYIQLSSGNNNYAFPKIFVWLLFLASIFGFYYALHNIITKLFALKLPSTAMWDRMDEQILLDNEMNSLLLIVGSPGSGKLKNLIALIQAGKLCCNMRSSYYSSKERDSSLLVYDPDDKSHNNVFIADMMKISAESGEFNKDWKQHKNEALLGHSLVIINHFEYNIKDSRANKVKLDLLEQLMEKDTGKIIIISTVHPLTFLDSFNEQQGNLIPESELERWHVLLGHFRIIIQPLETPETYEDKDKDVLRRILIQETQHTHFLKKMSKVALLDIPDKNDIDAIGPVGDSRIFKLQITSHYFYTYIWQSLTKEEKFLLYDLAEDGLVNPYDDYNLCMLIRKGLIIDPDGTLMLFNKGFRNFILTSIGYLEVERIKSQVKDNGNWGSLRTPLILVTLAILVFLITSQQEAYTRIIAYVTAFGAGVPAVLRIFSMFGNSNTQKTE